MASPDGRKRFLIAIGVGEYADPEFETLPEVKGDCATIVELFTGPFGYQHVLAALASNPTARQVRSQVSRWFSAKRRAAGDVVVFYFGGHGYTTALDQHYLCTRDFTARNPSDTGVRTADLVNLFWEGEGERPQSVWAIVDTCLSGHGTGGMLQQVGRITKEVFTGQRSGLWTLAAARGIDDAHDGKFVEAFKRVIDERLAHPSFGAASQEWFGTDGIVSQINEQLEKLGQLAQLGSAAVSGEFPFFPNPRFRSGAAGLDLEAQEQLASGAELALHWIPKAQGAELGESGWFFSGRATALAELVAWLGTAATDGRPRIVTGDPGSGKSAVLGRIVTLAHKATRKTVDQLGLLEGVPREAIPAVGIVDLAIHARGKSLRQVQGLLGTALGFGRDDYARALEALAARARPFRLVLDALDESPDAETIARDILRPLAALPIMRMIIGTRRPLVKMFGPNVVLLDLDTPTYLATADLESYVATRLVKGVFGGQTSPYKDPDVTRKVAGVVAAKAHPSFLIARLVCSRLARKPAPIDVEAKEWDRRLRDELPATLTDAYNDDLERFGKDRQRVIDVLRPLAYARGQGLPWARIWEAAASAISGRSYARSDVEEIQRAAGFYIVEDREAGTSVYRLFHESFAEYLRAPGEAEEVERRFAQALVGTVRTADDAPDWLNETRPYIRFHLAAHAAAAGMLADLASDPSFLAVANSDSLLPLLRRGQSAVPAPVRRLYASAVHDVRRSSPPDALSYLEMAARQNGVPEQLRPFRLASGRTWSVPWARWQPQTPSRVIETGHLSATTAVATFVMDGRAVVATGGQEGTVRIWDLGTGRPVGDPLPGRSRVRLILCGRDDEPPVIAVFSAGDILATCHVWDLRSRPPVPVEVLPRFYRARLGTLGGRPVVSARHRGGGRWWTMENGSLTLKTSEELGVSPRILSDVLRPMALFSDLSGVPVAFVTPSRGVLQLIDLRTGDRLGGQLKFRQGVPFRPPMVLDADQNGFDQLWIACGREIDGIPLTPQLLPRSPLRGSRGRVDLLAISKYLGARMLVSGDGPNVRVWDLDETDVKPNAQSWPHPAPATLFTFERAGRTLLVTPAGEQAMVCDASDGVDVRRIALGKFHGSGLGVGELEGRPVVILSEEGVVRLFDGESGAAVGKPMKHDDHVSAAVLSKQGDSPVLITISTFANNVVTTWNPLRGRRVGAPWELPEAHIAGGLVARTGDTPLLITHGSGELRSLDPFTRRPVRRRAVKGTLSSMGTAMIGGLSAVLGVIKTKENARQLCGWLLSDLSPAFAPIAFTEARSIQPVAGVLNGRTVIAIGHESIVRLWTPDGRRLLDVAVDARVSALALIPPQRIVAATNKGLVAIDCHG